MSTLEERDIMIEECRGQGYDNGANMKAKRKGVQARILDKNPRAFFVPCGCLSPSRGAAASSTESVTLFGILQRIYILFSASFHRWKILTDHVKGLTLKPLCDTRWKCRVNSLKPVRHQAAELHDALVDFVIKPAPRLRRKKRRFSYEFQDEVDDVETKFKREFYEMIDTVMSIEERFTQMEQHVSLWGFLYDLTRLPDKAELLKLCQGLDHAETLRKSGHGRYRSLREADLLMQPAAHWMQCSPGRPPVHAGQPST
ncbi:unnamed protein product [Ixodes pacificus]